MLMRATGGGLAVIATVCLSFIGEAALFKQLRECFCHGREAPVYMNARKRLHQEEYDEIHIADLFLCCCCDDEGRPGYRPVGTRDLDSAADDEFQSLSPERRGRAKRAVAPV